VKTKILFVAHCFLNTASKVVLYNRREIKAEEKIRRRFVHAALDAGIQLRQLPCPEFTMYGTKRWGHTSDQFDNPFFRRHCRNILIPVLEEASAYMADPKNFDVLGFAGIDGSPSCGVDYTCTGRWGGSLDCRDDLAAVVHSVRLVKRRGIFFDELENLLKEQGFVLPFTGLYAPEPEKIMHLAQ
jgi:predicted secreted protein